MFSFKNKILIIIDIYQQLIICLKNILAEFQSSDNDTIKYILYWAYI